jgi:hypothetical protein
MPDSPRTTILLKPADLEHVRRHKGSFLSQGFDLSMGQIIRLAVRELNPDAVATSSVETLVAEDRRRKRKSS